MSALVRLADQESVNVPAAVEHPANLHSLWRDPVSDHNPTLERNKPQAGAEVIAKPSGFGELGQPIAPLDDFLNERRGLARAVLRNVVVQGVEIGLRGGTENELKRHPGALSPLLVLAAKPVKHLLCRDARPGVVKGFVGLLLQLRKAL